MVETMAKYDACRGKCPLLKLGVCIHRLVLNKNELNQLLHGVLGKKYVTAEQATDPYTFLPFFHSMASEHDDNLIDDGRGRPITRVIDNVSWSAEKKLKANGL